MYRNTQVNDQDVQVVKNAWTKVPTPRMYENGNSLGPGGSTQRDAGVAGIAMDPEDENTIYIAYTSSFWEDPAMYEAPYGSKMVYRLDVSDLGSYPATGPFECGGAVPCTDLTMNLPNTIVDQECIAFEQGSDGGLYVATEAGIYFTDNKRIGLYDPSAPEDADDLGNTSGWVRLGGALPHVPAHGLEINYQINRIRAGLVGRGVWEHALHCPATLEFNETGTYPNDVFLEAENSITSDAIAPTGLKVDYRAGEEVHLTPGFHAQAGARFHGFIHPCDLSGNSFKPKNSITIDQGESVEADAGTLSGMTLFPNPAKDQVWIQLADVPSNKVSHAQLYDSRGQLVASELLLGPLDQMGLPDAAGLYTVIVHLNGNRCMGRVVVN